MKSRFNNTDADQDMPEDDTDQAMLDGQIRPLDDSDTELPEDDQVVLVVADDRTMPAAEEDSPDGAGRADLTGHADLMSGADPADFDGTAPAGGTELPGSSAHTAATPVEPDLAAVDPDGAVMAARSGTTPGGSSGSNSGNGAGEGWSEIQLRFVDDPRASVEMAAALVNDRVTALVGSVQDRQSSLASVLQGSDVDTEQLRTTLQQYRVFSNHLDGFSLES